MSRWGLILLLVAGGLVRDGEAQSPATTPPREFVMRFCADCHSAEEKTAGLALDTLSREDLNHHPDVWEKVVRKLRARQMPPPDVTRPDEPTYDAALTSLESALDKVAVAQPRPGRTDTFRRLNRSEYRNAIRDLLDLEIDANALLPTDQSSHGFDSLTVGDLSPTRLDRYISAAQKISRLAVGGAGRSPGGDTIRIRADITQEDHVPGLPIGTRGGALIPYTFPQDGEYEIRVRLSRDRNEEVEGLTEPHELEVLLDRERVALFKVTPPPGRKNWERVDEHLKLRLAVTAGRHQLGVTFIKQPSSLLETKRQPYQAHFNTHRHPRITPAVFQVSITGPYETKGPGDTRSRQRVFVRRPTTPDEDNECARQILSTLMRRAFRRPITAVDLQRPMELYRAARAESGFDAGIEMALSSILVNPQFLFRIDRDPAGVAPKTVYRVSDVELASRLSFFLWSSIPDDELLDLAEAGELSHPSQLKQQVRRMLGDPRAQSLATSFANQWLHLRNLDSITPDARLFPDFDDNLRQALRQETELLFDSVRREDRSVLDLLTADYTYLNERPRQALRHSARLRQPVPARRARRRERARRPLAAGEHPDGDVVCDAHLAGHPRQVDSRKPRRHAAPPPPANVPALKDKTVAANLSVRERLAEHRDNAACASCHKLTDPVGFTLENFDAVGRWRTLEDFHPVDATGGLPDGSQFTGVAGLEQALLNRPRSVRRHPDRKVAHVFAGPRSRMERRAGRPKNRPRRPERGLSLLIADRRHRR